MKRVAFVTGGTGLLGSWLVRSILLSNDFEAAYVLVRADSEQSAECRMRKALQSISASGIDKQLLKKLKTVRGNIDHPRLGLSPSVVRSVTNDVTDFFHAAALAGFRIPMDVIRTPNVLGTRHVCDMAALSQREGARPVRLHHISTVFIAGTLQGYFSEDQFFCGQQFHNSYERSKFEAEQIVKEYSRKGIRATIYRPGIITGDSVRGVTTNFKMFYQPLHLISGNLFQEFPASRNCLHSFVPVDSVARAICLLSKVDELPDCAWHLINPYEVSLERFVDVAASVFRCHKPNLVPIEDFPASRYSPVQWNLVEPFLPYFNYPLRFQADQTISRLKKLGFCWPKMNDEMLTRLFQYCIDSGFIKLRNKSSESKTVELLSSSSRPWF